jgi:predicted regulator of Ras-like GTPase activity (Roadblock/LC7/MglB family)
MRPPSLVVLEHDHARLASLLDRLRHDANAKLTLLLDRNGQQIAHSGEFDGADPTALASLTAGNVAATDGLAKLIGERGFTILLHEGANDHLHLSVVAEKTILLVRFDERSSPGLVRLRVQHASAELAAVIHEMTGRSGGPGAGAVPPSPLQEITEEDVDALFG